MWHTYLENGEFLCGLYDVVPPLVDVDISSIHATYDNRTIAVGLDLSRYADHPSKKWRSSDNTVHLGLVFFDCHDLEWIGWECDNICNIEINPMDGGRFIVQVTSDVVNVSFTAGRIISRNVDAYCREDRE